MPNDHPVVLVHGLFGWGPTELGGFPYWGTGRTVPSPLPRREAAVGPISSLHDRACELAFQLKGGTVDYGAAHAAAAGHSRHGRTFSGSEVLHPLWSAARPIHLVGHSMGGPTIVRLQQLLADDYFGWGSTADWVASISSISGVLNGSTATYFTGADPATGMVDAGDAAVYLALGIELALRATGGLFEAFYDFQLEQWDLEAHPGEDLAAYVARIAESRLFEGRDNAAYDLSIQGMLAQNATCATHPGTHYFSYVTQQTTTGFLSGHAYPRPDMNPSAVATSFYIGRATYPQPFYPGFDARDWWPNDGLVPSYSQMFPRTAGNHPIGGRIGTATAFDPGRWYYEVLDEVDHLDIVSFPQLNQIGWQKRFYMRLYDRLASL